MKERTLAMLIALAAFATAMVVFAAVMSFAVR